MRIINDDFDLKKIAESGQCFRLYQVNEKDFTLYAMGRVLNLHQEDDGVTLDCSLDDFNSIWYDYFDLETDYSEIRASIPSNDKFLKEASEYGKGIRILKQDIWETLCTFIISQRKNIPAIQSSVEKICDKCGLTIFPNKEMMKKLELNDFYECSLGYRAPYLYELAHRDIDINTFSKLSDEELVKALMSIKGVGVKVANCTCLFGYHRLNSFPIDVWIKRVIDNEYNGKFDSSIYSPYAGVIQQYMFYYYRNMKK